MIQSSARAESDGTAMGARIRKAREDRGFSLQAVADRMGVSKGTVGHWETGVRAIKHDDLAKLCTLLQISADEVLFGIRRWPFRGIDFDLVNDLEPRELGVLEGALLQMASDRGLVIRRELAMPAPAPVALNESAHFRKVVSEPLPKRGFTPPKVSPTVPAAQQPGTSLQPSSVRSARKPSQPAKPGR